MEDASKPNRGPYEYICVSVPPLEDEVEEKGSGDMFRKPAKEHPEWKWYMMWKAYRQFADAVRDQEYRDPDV